MTRSKLEKCSTGFLKRMLNSQILIDVPKGIIQDILSKRSDEEENKIELNEIRKREKIAEMNEY